jgi:uncharacterized protein (DUF2141 family)
VRMKVLSMLALALAGQGLAAHGQAAPAPAATVTVNVTGIKTNVGKVIISLCTKKQFGASPCTYVTTTPALTGGVSVVFNTVAPGRYMAAAFQDIDGNGELKFTLTGPGEPAGVSGPERLIPDFDKAAFDVGAEPKTINMKIK